MGFQKQATRHKDKTLKKIKGKHHAEQEEENEGEQQGETW
jgi:hypothetical protein